MSSPPRTPVAVLGDGILAKFLWKILVEDGSFEFRPVARASVVFDACTRNASASLRREALSSGARIVALVPTVEAVPIIPAVNLNAAKDLCVVGLVSSLAQAAVPLVHAVSTSVDIEYAESIVSVPGVTLDIGDRDHLDEVITTTEKTLVSIGGAQRAKVCMLVNSCTPPMGMRVVVHCLIEAHLDRNDVETTVRERLRILQLSCAFYQRATVELDGRKVTIRARVGSANHEASFAGNLEIMAASALRVARSWSYA
jgi:acetaldehyde dehydrogenase